MAAILGKKLGMTQVFREDGTVVPVTVIEAGPCKVTAVRETERDGYAAVQLAFGEVKEGKLTRAEEGHTEEGRGSPRCATWSSSATRTSAPRRARRSGTTSP